MSARELPVPETPEKAKERFASWQSEPSDDWLYFGTVHHHCSTSAFQSATDEQNEWNQDGVHITVGKMDAEQHDLHARLYLGGNCFEPDLSRFWPVDPDLAARVPAGMHNELARFQMCGKVTVDFPDAWRKNLMDVEREQPSSVPDSHWSQPDPAEAEYPLCFRAEEALEEIANRCAIIALNDDHWQAVLKTLSTSDASRIIVEACLKHDVTPDELLAELSQFTFEY